MAEAAGVELFSVLTTRKLLIPGTATTAKKAPLPDPLYVYCTKMLTLWRLADPHSEQYANWEQKLASCSRMHLVDSLP
jgi:hypothetical protein